MVKAIVGLALLLAASQAQAFSKELRAAAFLPRTGSCSGCTRETVLPSGAGQPEEVMTIPSGGGKVLGVMQFPTEATSAALTFRVLSMRGSSGSGNDHFCTKICAGVVFEGQVASALDLSACTLASDDTKTTIWQEIQSDFTSLGLTPKDASGLSCDVTCPGAHCCLGGDLYISLERVASGSCAAPNGSTDSQAYKTVVPYFQ